MKTRTLKQLLLYNYRYIFAYAAVIGFGLYFLLWRLQSVGPGISSQELQVAAQNTSLTAIAKYPVNVLHSLLQYASMKTFGISALTIRLPDVVLAAAAVFSLYNLLKRWFGKSTALLSSALFISADWYLYTARFATGGIEFSFWLVIALLSLTKLLEHKTRWSIPFSIALSCMLFTPFGVYAIAALLVSIFTARVLRERLLEVKPLYKGIDIGIGIITLAAFIFSCIQGSGFLRQILGVSNLPNVGEYISTLFSSLSAPVAVLPNAVPIAGPTGVLVVRIFEFAFIAFGVIMLWRTRINRLNLIVLVLSVVLAIVSGLSESVQNGNLLLIPAAIYMTAGIRHLMHRWRRTFPNNPYARLAAYVPLGVLFICVIGLHYALYFVLWPQQRSTHIAFTQDFALAQAELQKTEYKNKSCYVQSDSAAFKTLLSATQPQCNLTYNASTKAQLQLLNPTENQKLPVAQEGQTVRALSSDSAQYAMRWVVVINQSR